MIRSAHDQADGREETPPERPRRVLEANDLILRDHYGIARVLISGGSESNPGPSLTMLDDKATVRLRVGLSDHPSKNPAIALYDGHGQRRATIGITEHEGATTVAIAINKGDDRQQIGMITTDRGGPNFTVFDTTGADRIVAGLDSDDQPFLAFLDDAGDLIDGAVFPQAIRQILDRCRHCRGRDLPDEGEPPTDQPQPPATGANQKGNPHDAER